MSQVNYEPSAVLTLSVSVLPGFDHTFSFLIRRCDGCGFAVQVDTWTGAHVPALPEAARDLLLGDITRVLGIDLASADRKAKKALKVFRAAAAAVDAVQATQEQRDIVAIRLHLNALRAASGLAAL